MAVGLVEQRNPMTEPNLPRSPFAPADEPTTNIAVRAVPRSEVVRVLAAHGLYLETRRKQGERANLSSADLSEANFVSMRLRRARFDHARLQGANFSRAELSRANLIGAFLKGAVMSDADLTGPG